MWLLTSNIFGRWCSETVTADNSKTCCFIPVFLKVGGIAPLGAILNGKVAKKTKGAIGGRNNTKGAKMLNHYSIIEWTSVAYYYDLLVSCKS